MARPATVVVTASALLVLSCSAVNAGPVSHRPAAATSASSGLAPGRYAAAVSHPVQDPYYPAEGTTSVDALHYGLHLAWDDTTRTLSGVERLAFRVPHDERSVSLDLAKTLHVSAVSFDGRQLVIGGAGGGGAVDHRGHKLNVALGPLRQGERHALVIHYSGKPHPVAAPTTRKDIPDLGWTVQPDGEVWTMQEPFGAFTWYPVNDQPSDKAYYDITVNARSSWHSVSNGRLVSDTTRQGRRTMHWRLDSPASSYLVTIAIGPYRDFHDTGPHGLPITYWVRPRDQSLMSPLFRTPRMLHWLESKLGPYPFHTLGVVLVPSTSGMETQTMVTLGVGDLRRPTGVSDLLHEYSHQWYGDAVTPKTWIDVWLNESFAMYTQIRWEASHGIATMAGWRAELDRYDQMLRSKYGPPGRYDRRNFAELNVYFCGARMLDRLHRVLGNRVFDRVLEGWPRKHRFGNANRGEWIRYLDHTTGRDLKHFVHRWLDSKVSPR